jgi:hypothetical protein
MRLREIMDRPVYAALALVGSQLLLGSVGAYRSTAEFDAMPPVQQVAYLQQRRAAATPCVTEICKSRRVFEEMWLEYLDERRQR